jgi:hypothetical protein
MTLNSRISASGLFSLIFYITILISGPFSCSKSRNIDLSGEWKGFLTIDFCGKDYVEKSNLVFISEGDKIIQIKQTILNNIDYSRNDPESCEENSISETQVIVHPENLPKIISKNEFQHFLAEWDGLEAAHSYNITKFHEKELIVRAVLSGNFGDIQTRTYTR